MSSIRDPSLRIRCDPTVLEHLDPETFGSVGKAPCQWAGWTMTVSWLHRPARYVGLSTSALTCVAIEEVAGTVVGGLLASPRPDTPPSPRQLPGRLEVAVDAVALDVGP